jgi:hypothetical protein
MRRADCDIVHISLMVQRNRNDAATDDRYDVGRIAAYCGSRLAIAMLAPYLSGLLCMQSDLGHPAGVVLAT